MKDGRPYVRPQKANECIAALDYKAPPQMLFDEFWREGELALLFGAPSAGKSIFAVELAESIARGRAIGTFRMQGRRQKVLYVDLNLSDRQFGARYFSKRREKTGAYVPYCFSENIHRSRPDRPDELCDWVREHISASNFGVIVIDDITALQKAADGTRGTLPAMRELKEIKDEFGISILVLTTAREPKPGRVVSEADLMRSRVLCSVADSVFAIGVHPSDGVTRYILQTRAINPSVWNATNAPTFSVLRNDNGMISMVPDKRFTPCISEERRRLICEIRRMRVAGLRFREIGPELGISRATAARLCKRWTPDMEALEVPSSTGRPSSAQETIDNADKPYYRADHVDRSGGLDEEVLRENCDPLDDLLDEIDRERDNAGKSVSGNIAIPPDSPERGPQLSLDADEGVSIALSRLKRSFDRDGREIFVEKEGPNGRRLVWYGHNKAGRFSRFERSALGIQITAFDGFDP